MNFNPTNNANSLAPNPSESNWTDINAEWENSKESQADFCKRKNINLNTFTYWRSKFILKRAKRKATPRFIPVTVSPDKYSLSSGVTIENKLGIKIIIPADASVTHLKEILKLVGFIHA